MVVANYLSLLQELVRYNRDTHPAQSARISLNLKGAFTPIAAQNGGGDGSPIDEHAIEKPLVGMIIYGANVIRERIAVRFARLGHQVRYIDAFRPRPSNRVRNAPYQQIGNQAGIEGAGAQENQVRLVNRLEDFRQRPGGRGQETYAADATARARYFGLTPYSPPAIEERLQSHIGGGGRIDPSADGQHLAGEAHGLGEVAGNIGERRQEQVAEAVAGESATNREAILEEAPKQCLIFREANEAVANVARGKNGILAAQAAGTSAIIGDGDYGDEVGDGEFIGPGKLFRAAGDVMLEAAQKHGEAGAAAERDNANRIRTGLLKFIHGSSDR